MSTLPQTVTVTATLDPAAGLVWGDVGDWTGTAGSADPLTLSVPLDAAPESCTVAPAAVAEVVKTQSVCAGGVAQSATIVLPVDDAGVVTYAADPASAPEDVDGEYAVSTLPQTVTVTATLDPAAGLVWGDVGDWTGTAGSADPVDAVGAVGCGAGVVHGGAGGGC